jgi:hypothetical protein
VSTAGIVCGRFIFRAAVQINVEELAIKEIFIRYIGRIEAHFADADAAPIPIFTKMKIKNEDF